MTSSTIIAVVLCSAILGLASCQTCKFSQSNVQANWKVVNGAVQIAFQNKRISNNQWTAIAFGDSMQDLAVIIFQVMNNQVTVRTGRTTGYGPPTLDSQNNVNVQFTSYTGNTLSAVVNVPMNLNGRSLQQCGTWNFIESGPLNNGNIGKHTNTPRSVQNVCATQCS